MLRNIYKGNFQPRVSVAYRPFNDTKTVIRAGFGIYTMTNLGPLSFNNSGNPTSSLHTYTNSSPPRVRHSSSFRTRRLQPKVCNMAVAVSIRGLILTTATAIQPMERDSRAAAREQRQFARQLCRIAQLSAEYY